MLQDTIYLRRLKHEVLPDIPAKNFTLTKVQLRPEQDRLYQADLNDLAFDVHSVDDREFQRRRSSFLARRARLLQVCSHPGVFDPHYDEEPAKFLALDRLVEEIVDQAGEKVVIWSYYRFSLDHIARRFASRGLVRIDGTITGLDDRIQAVRRFQEDAETHIFLGNAAAAGAGITLTAARHAIYESYSNQAAHWLQSIDRIHRRGQDRDVMCHVLITANTLEEREFARLQQKERVARDLLGDVYDEPITRERFLADLGVDL